MIARANRKTVYVGEQITVDFTFYNRLDLADIQMSERPTFNDCWVEPVFDAQQLNFQQQTINGVVYNAALLKKTALFPIAPGKVTISPMKLMLQIIVRRGFFNNDIRPVEIATDPITVTVTPLPGDQPESFTGGVGKFTMSALLDRDSSIAAEPIYLTVRITGTGNIRLIEKPPIPRIPGITILDPEVKDNVNTSGPAISGSKEFRYPLIPTHDGTHMIPGIRIAYFDPGTASYKTIETESMTFIATRTAAAVQAVQTDGMKVLGSDIRYIKDDHSALPSYPWYLGSWVAVFYLLGALCVGISLIVRKHQARMLTDRAYARKLRASRAVKKNLGAAQQALKQGRIPEFLDLLSRVLLGYVGDRFNIDPGALTKEQLISILRDRGVDEDILQQLNDLLHHCDVMRYSPDMTCENPGELYTTARNLLNKL
jgi:hypothetical protein